MADYIYLLPNRLTPAQWRALEAVREAARAHSTTVFLVGGAVRDLTTGTPVRDLDFAIQGDPELLVPDLEAGGATITGRNPVLSSVYLTLRGGVRAEIGSTVTVTYPKPGQPTAQPAAILDDLRRRDFTANAMALSLNEGSYGLLLDPLNGTADIENRELRLVSNYGFIEQPGLLLRAARLTGRLGWTLEERTESRYQTAKEEGYISALSTFDRGYELEEVFHEEDPLAILEHLDAEGWRETLFGALSADKGDKAGLDAVRDLVGQLEALGIHPDVSVVNFPLLTSKLNPQDVAAVKELFVRPGFVQQIESIDGRSKELAAQLTSKAAALPSDTWKLLFAADPEVILWTAYNSRSSAVQAKLKAFLRDWPQMRQKMPYGLMQEMRITPDLPGYDQLLEDLFLAQIDGKLSTTEATRAFLEPFSPPAPPPQVSVRRRPAKATRGRSRKSVEEPVESVDPTEDEDSAPDLDDMDVDDESSADEDEAEPKLDDEVEEDEQEPAPVPVQTPAKRTVIKVASKQVPATDPSQERSASASAKAPSKGAKKVAVAEPEIVKPNAPAAKLQKSADEAGVSVAATAKAATKAAPSKAAQKSPAHKVPAKVVVKAPTKQHETSTTGKTPAKVVVAEGSAIAKKPAKQTRSH